MADISNFITMLRSEDHNQRYQACEGLRMSKTPLPQEALDALAMAKNDKNQDVADAAQKALAIHLPNKKEEVINNNQNLANENMEISQAEITAARIAGLSLVGHILPPIGSLLSLVICLIINAKYTTRKNAAATQIKTAFKMSVNTNVIILLTFFISINILGLENESLMLPGMLLIPVIIFVAISGLGMAFSRFPKRES